MSGLYGKAVLACVVILATAAVCIAQLQNPPVAPASGTAAPKDNDPDAEHRRRQMEWAKPPTHAMPPSEIRIAPIGPPVAPTYDPTKPIPWRASALYSSRKTPEIRSAAIAKGGGTPEGEDAVMRALDWLKKHQNKDGSWGGQYRTAMTGLALLSFLGHGERPDSAQYGETVLRANQYLSEIARKSNDGRLAHQHVSYQHAIATAALAENYALTPLECFRAPVESSIGLIVRSQCANGSWDYDYNTVAHDDARRPYGDTSISGWNLHALEAGKYAELKNDDLRPTINKARGFLRSVYDEQSHRFGYAAKGPGSGALFGIGLFYLRPLDSRDRESKGAFEVARTSTCVWGNTPYEERTYTWYYLTQAFFQMGGRIWDQWNRRLRDELISHQRADGSWPVPGATDDAVVQCRQVPNPQDQLVYHTSMMCMMLEVYYRFLPTFK